MKILHYLFGLPPVRSGGLVRYALDLAEKEIELGHDVDLIVPGRFTKLQTDKTRIIKGKWKKNTCYKILNPLPVLYGKAIDDVSMLYKQSDKAVFVKFLNENKPDVIHVHSFMGLHVEFLEAAKHLNISIVYTTHDYYGICPNALLMKNGKQCRTSDGIMCADCVKFCTSIKKVKNEHSEVYRIIKCNKIVNWLEYSQRLVSIKIYIRSMLKKNKQQNTDAYQSFDSSKIKQYQELSAYYKKMFKYIDKFHFNSRQTREIFEEHLGELCGETKLISNKSIEDKRIKKTYNKQLKIAFIGHGENKGYGILYDALKQLYENGMQDFVCNIYFNPKNKLPKYIVSHAPYSLKEVDEIYNNIDVLVLPSIWKETFGLVVLEALSHGVPVIVSENVGSKEILEKNQGIGYVIEADKDALYEGLAKIYRDRNILKQMNEAICNAEICLDFDKHVDEMVRFYKDK